MGKNTIVLALALASLYPAAVLSQQYPSKPIRLIVPFPAGGGVDYIGRIVGKGLSERLGQQVIVDNRPGGGTTLATELAAKAPADGHTFLHGITAFGVNPSLYARLPYDTLKDFSCITHIGNLYGVLLAHPQFPVKSVAELIKLAKARPGEVAYATGGAGTANHIAAEALRLAGKIDIVHVPYKGTGQALPDVLSGRVPLLATVLVEVVPYIQSKKLKVIAATSPKRAPSLPDVPTIGETLPGYKPGTGFWTLVTRSGAPAATLNKLHADAVKAFQAPDVRARLASADIEIVGSRPGECDAFLREQVSVWGALVKASGARVD
jgi:tripartite-type tricarboxylate transporter receptor subunit TctC